jgi:hypothetical protein
VRQGRAASPNSPVEQARGFVRNRGHRDPQPEPLKLHFGPLRILAEEANEIPDLLLDPRGDHRQLRQRNGELRELGINLLDLAFPIGDRTGHASCRHALLDGRDQPLKLPLCLVPGVS